MKTGLVIFVIFIVVLFIAGFLLVKDAYQFGSINSANSSGYKIQIANFAYSPSNITIKTGDTVVWTNSDPVPQTVVSDTGNELNSPPIYSGDTYSHTFKDPGTYEYHCSINTIMKGEVIVQ